MAAKDVVAPPHGFRWTLVIALLVCATSLNAVLLVALLRRAGRVVPRSALLSEAGRGDVAVGERTVDVHISKLSKKLGDDPKTPHRIQTVRGVGYVLARER